MSAEVGRCWLWLWVAICSAGLAPKVFAVSINEIRIDQFSDDDDEFFELEGSSDESLDDLTYLVIGDSSAAQSGAIEAIVPLDGLTIPSDGFFLAAESSFGAPGTAFDGIVADLTTSLLFENSDNVTHLLVSGFSGANGDDLDTNDDGTLDIMPWGVVIDAIGLVESPDLSASGSEWFYGTGLGGADIGPDGNFVPAHVFRQNNGGSAFAIGEFSLDVNDPDITIDDTPGRSNTSSTSGNDGDFDDNGQYECADIDLLVAVIADGTNSSAFDITDDGQVNLDDLVAWLLEAGALGGLTASGGPVLSGDANLDGTVDGADFLVWNNNKFNGFAAWCRGDFDASGFVDGADFLAWNNNKFQASDALAVPEPTALAWLLWGGGVWLLSCRNHRCRRGG